MSLLGSPFFFSSGAAGGFYSHTIDQSLRFEDGDNPNLSKSWSTTASSTTAGTFSAWVKRGNLGITTMLLSSHLPSPLNASAYIYFDTTDQLKVYLDSSQSGSDEVTIATDAIFRDVSSWYHVHVKYDVSQSTTTDKAKVYVNGTQQSTTASTLGSAVTVLRVVTNGLTTKIGQSYDTTFDFDGYIAELHYVDGQSLDPTSFGETKAGIWIPKEYSGSYGTNGFRLKFQDSSALGDDTSGNGNDFSSSGLAATDVVLDSPTNNFATMNPLDGNGPTISEGNLKVFGDTSFSVFEGFKGTFPMSSGKWYWEVYISVGGFTQTGITPTTNTAVISTTNLSYHTDAMTYESNGNKAIGTGGTGTAPTGRTSSSYGSSYTTGDIIGVALDLDSATTTLTFYKNNSSQGTAFSSLASDEYVPVHAGIQNNFGIFNFGQDSSFAGNETAQGNTDGNGIGDFYYSPPSGYLACCSANLPDPAIDPAQNEEPADYFNTVLYTGNGSTQSITGVGFQPDWVWGKQRSGGTNSHSLHDVVRGATRQLYSNLTLAEFNNVNSLTSFDSDGFSVGSHGMLNSSGQSVVAWNWKAGGSAVSNTDGSITSSVSANTKAGFSIVSYTGGGSAGDTVGHGLNSAPEMIIVKRREIDDNWPVYHSSNTSAPETDSLFLNKTDATQDLLYWNDTAPSSTVFTLGSNFIVNKSGETFIAYCFHSLDGYSKVGSYTGNNSSDGAFVYTGFRPAWVMVKAYSTGGTNYDWAMYDSGRSPTNAIGAVLEANQSQAEVTGTGRGLPIDFVSNGFKFRSSYAESNAAVSYIYLAFAEQPFKYSNAR